MVSLSNPLFLTLLMFRIPANAVKPPFSPDDLAIPANFLKSNPTAAPLAAALAAMPLRHPLPFMTVAKNSPAFLQCLFKLGVGQPINDRYRLVGSALGTDRFPLGFF